MNYQEENTVQRILETEIDRMSSLLKSIANPKRLQILLSLLTQETMTAADLIGRTKLSKTALQNHLSYLEDAKLITHPSRGIYLINEIGKKLISGNLRAYQEYQDVQNFITNVHEKQFAQYNRGISNLPEEFDLSSEIKWVNCWDSYISSITGILQAKGKQVDLVDVAGYSGQCFIINTRKDELAIQDAYFHKAWNHVHLGTERLGYKLEVYTDPKTYPSDLMNPTKEDIKRATYLFQKVKFELSQFNRPIILWGFLLPLYGIVTGFTQQNYKTAPFTINQKIQRTIYQFNELNAPRYLQAIFIREDTEALSKVDDLKAIERAIILIENSNFALTDHVYGPEAYDEWASIIEKTLSTAKQNQKISCGYFGELYLERKEFSIQFLQRIALRARDKPQSIFLTKAAEEYKKIKALLTQFTLIFPMYEFEDISNLKYQQGADILRECKHFEYKALKFLKDARDLWQ
ncbi:ArsR/SmtB family transcription factor [Candidatus Lokiarchaeum ossiferum]|uniref:ArsR/SmtB family transcription factor n=1 Tax=Candidatus Lokiarchaeum ossiferum TaxID=2951803 RepID=UPI00352D5A9D